MNKELKNRGLTGVTLAVWIGLAVALVGFLFVPGNAIYEAPLFNKIGGIVLGVTTLAWMFLSGDLLIDKVKSHIVLQILQIGVSFALGLTAMLTYTNAW